jgi:hypothetical protein
LTVLPSNRAAVCAALIENVRNPSKSWLFQTAKGFSFAVPESNFEDGYQYENNEKWPQRHEEFFCDNGGSTAPGANLRPDRS